MGDYVLRQKIFNAPGCDLLFLPSRYRKLFNKSNNNNKTTHSCLKSEHLLLKLGVSFVLKYLLT